MRDWNEVQEEFGLVCYGDVGRGLTTAVSRGVSNHHIRCDLPWISVEIVIKKFKLTYLTAKVR